MDGSQATLDGESVSEEETVAGTLADDKQSISIAEFFERNKHMLGFGSPGRALFTAIKEGVDNGLDAAEEAEIYPQIDVTVTEKDGYYNLVIEDNGPGITREEIPKVFGKLLYGSRFHRRAQARGQQGIGISAAVLYSQLSTGNSTLITSKTGPQQKARRFRLNIDTEKNDPVVESEEVVDWEKENGTRIEFTIEANLRARSQIHEYIQNTAIANPHATVTINEPKLDERRRYEKVDGVELPDKVEEIPPHPHGVELGQLKDMLKETQSYSVSGFLQDDFTRVGETTADRILEGFKQRYYGRELPLTQSIRSYTEAEIRGLVTDSINRKPAEVCETLGENIASEITSQEPTLSHLRDIIETESNSVQNESGTRIGESVRTSIYESLCSNASSQSLVEEFLSDAVSAATSRRKDDSQCKRMGEQLTSLFEVPPSSAEDFRVTERNLEAAVEEASESLPNTWGETAQGNITEEIWARLEEGNQEVPGVSEVVSDQAAVEALLGGMQSAKVSRPPSKCLSPIGEETIEAGLQNNYDADFYSAASRSASAHGGDPFIIEAGIAYGGDQSATEKMSIDRFANRVPLVYQGGGCAITNVVKQIDWKNYNLSQSSGSLPEGPVSLMVHVASTNVPFTSESKDVVASIEEIENEIERAVREVARDMKRFTKQQQRMENRRKRENITSRVVPAAAEKFAEVTGDETPDTDRTMARILNNILVHRKETADGYEVTIKNFTNKSRSFTLREVVDSPADITTEVGTVQSTGEEGYLEVEVSLPSMETQTVEYQYTGGSQPRLETPDIADTLVSIRRD